MGLDAVELVIAIEERFGIAIENAEAEKIRTPRMLIELVLQKVQISTASRCQSQRAFYLLRRALISQSAMPRNQIKPETPVRAFLNSIPENIFWQNLQASTGAARWPALALSEPVALLRTLLVMGALLAGTVAAWPYLTATLAILFWLLGGIAGMYITNLIDAPFRQYTPKQIQTLADLVPFAVTSAQTKCEISPAEVRSEVRRIIVDQLGLKESAYHEDADFVKDLGMD